ncbi:V-type ATPase subunit [Anaerococcus sp. AGMB09787]|uniref:V-type ATPase subunit n=1 Tax=Anaerococcus sp. AGMB09787 TaxID=2922869 RepID=UPI001FAEBAE0|nr:V-type ATPase subunit [Anaerococcus sp. AGMB09787]
MKQDDYIGASISTRINEKNLLTRSDFERLNDLDTIDEVLNNLSDTIYRDSIDELSNAQEYEEILKKELKRSYALLEELAPDNKILNYMKEKYHFHNLKVMVKEIIQGKDYKNLYMDLGGLDLAFIKKNLIKEEKKDSFDFVLGDKKEEDLPREEKYLSFAKVALEKFEESNNPQDIDLSLDKDFYQMKLKDAKEMDSEKLIDFTREEVDLTNLVSLLRVKSQDESLDLLKESLIDGGFISRDKFIDYFSYDINRIREAMTNTNIGKYVKDILKDDRNIDEMIMALEKVIDDHLTDFTIDSKMVTFGPEVLMNFLISKEIEIKNLRILLVAKQNNLDKDLTLERLRKSYV